MMKAFSAMAIIAMTGFCQAADLGHGLSETGYRCPVKDKLLRNAFVSFQDICSWEACGKYISDLN